MSLFRKFSKDRLFDAAGRLGDLAGKSSKALFDTTMEVAKTSDQAISAFMTRFSEASGAGAPNLKEISPVASDHKTIEATTFLAQQKFCKWVGCASLQSSEEGYCPRHLFEYGKFVQRHHGQKIRHQDYETAYKHARDLERRQNRDFLTYQAYQCEVCRGWHVGHDRDKPGLDMKDEF